MKSFFANHFVHPTNMLIAIYCFWIDRLQITCVRATAREATVLAEVAVNGVEPLPSIVHKIAKTWVRIQELKNKITEKCPKNKLLTFVRIFLCKMTNIRNSWNRDGQKIFPTCQSRNIWKISRNIGDLYLRKFQMMANCIRSA